MLEIRYSEDARSDIKEIWFYIQEDNPVAADAFVHKVYEQCRLISENPDIGTAKPEIEARLKKNISPLQTKSCAKWYQSC